MLALFIITIIISPLKDTQTMMNKMYKVDKIMDICLFRKKQRKKKEKVEEEKTHMMIRETNNQRHEMSELEGIKEDRIDQTSNHLLFFLWQTRERERERKKKRQTNKQTNNKKLL